MSKEPVKELDNCQVCFGVCGGVKGNENHVSGLVVCDHCHVAMGYKVIPSPPEPRTFDKARAHNKAVWAGATCSVDNCHYCKVNPS